MAVSQNLLLRELDYNTTILSTSKHEIIRYMTATFEGASHHKRITAVIDSASEQLLLSCLMMIPPRTILVIHLHIFQ